MKTRAIRFTLATVLAFGAASASADHTETILCAAIGSATGAAVGHSIGGRGNVIVWSAIGGAAGAAIGHSLGEDHGREVVVHRRARYVDDHDHYVVVRRPRHVHYVYEEPLPHHRMKRGHDHHHREWGDD